MREITIGWSECKHLKNSLAFIEKRTKMKRGNRKSFCNRIVIVFADWSFDKVIIIAGNIHMTFIYPTIFDMQNATIELNEYLYVLWTLDMKTPYKTIFIHEQSVSFVTKIARGWRMNKKEFEVQLDNNCGRWVEICLEKCRFLTWKNMSDRTDQYLQYVCIDRKTVHTAQERTLYVFPEPKIVDQLSDMI